MKSFSEFVENIQEQELGEFLRPPKGIKTVEKNSRKVHKDIKKLWDKFIKDSKNLGYITPKGENSKFLSLHNTKFSDNDVNGRFTLRLPKQ